MNLRDEIHRGVSKGIARPFILWIWATFFIPFIVWPFLNFAADTTGEKSYYSDRLGENVPLPFDFDPDNHLDFDPSDPRSSYDFESFIKGTLSPSIGLLGAYDIQSKYKTGGIPTKLFEQNQGWAQDFAAELSAFQASLILEDNLREDSLSKGVVDSEGHLRIFQGLASISAAELVEELNATTSASEPKQTPYTEADAETILKLAKDIIAYAHQRIQDPPEDLLENLKDSSSLDRLKYLLDRNRIQLPIKNDGTPYTKAELEGKPRVEMTWAGTAPVLRVLFPNREPSFILRDDCFVSRLDPYYQLLIARQLVRAGEGSGRPTMTIALTAGIPAASKIVVDYLERPKGLSIQRIDAYARAALPPTTTEDYTFMVPYVFGMTALAYLGEYLKAYGFPKIDSTLFTESFAALTNPNIRGQVWGDLGEFYANHFSPIQSHIALSALIGWKNPAYRFMIYHGPQWWQSVKHFAFISWPAGFWTEAVTRGASVGGAVHVAENSLWTNTVRPHLYAPPTARSEHRLNTQRLRWWPHWKWQKIETEMAGFLPLFAAKYMALIHLSIGSRPMGDYIFAAMLPIAFFTAYSYFTFSKVRDFSKERAKLVSAVLSPFSLAMITFYMSHVLKMDEKDFGLEFWDGIKGGMIAKYAATLAVFSLRSGYLYEEAVRRGKLKKAPSDLARLLAKPGAALGRVCKGLVGALGMSITH